MRAASCTSCLNIARCACCASVRGFLMYFWYDRMHHFPFHVYPTAGPSFPLNGPMNPFENFAITISFIR